MRRPTYAIAPALAALLLSVCAMAQGAAEPEAAKPEPTEAELRAAEAWDALPPGTRDVLTKLEEANVDVEDVKARVTYERAIPLLDEKEKSRGKLTFMKPNLLILELGKPRNEEVRTDGKLWWVVSHNDEQVEVYRAAESGEGGMETAFLLFGYGRSVRDMLADYTVELTEPAEGEAGDGPETVHRLKFIPIEDPERPARYAAIEVKVSEETWLPHEFMLHESGGEIVHTYALSRISTNTGLEPDDFEYEPPGDYTEVAVQDL